MQKLQFRDRNDAHIYEKGDIFLKSERLRKLENEYKDLSQWLKLGLVPKKDIEKHKKEMESLEQRIEEEKRRLTQMKESGDDVEYTTAKRNPTARGAYPETHTMPGVDSASSEENSREGNYEASESFEPDTATFGDSEETGEKTAILDDDEEDPFSDKSRWKRGILEDPDADNW